MNKWTQYKFRFNDDPVNPEWWIDLFIIDTVFRDATNKHNPKLWRFHRRSANDSVGHQLSLLIYMEAVRSPHIEHIFINSTTIKILNKHGLIKSFSVEYMESGIEKTSDAMWPDNLQTSWPYFAHGACRMYIGLLENDFNYTRKNISQIEKYYAGLGERMMYDYSDTAAHAYIHHVSALFGYPKIKLKI